MKILVGLGNPGAKYETTRHNIGFLLIDRLVDSLSAGEPKEDFRSQIWQAKKGEKLLLVKPQTYMNRSGEAVQPLLHFYKAEPKDLIVFHDDVDLKRFSLKIKTGGGAGGHNGIRSIDQALGTPDYTRARLGVGRSTEMPTDAHVLQRFSDEELKDLDSFLGIVEKATELLIEGKTKEAMNQFNNRGVSTESESPEGEA